MASKLQCLSSSQAYSTRTILCERYSIQALKRSSQSRSFHASPNHQRRTKLRTELNNWLKGPGRLLFKSLPGSTNYLGAYDSQGNLKRLRRGRFQQNEQEQEILAKEVQEKLSPEERDERAAERRELANSRGGIPKEGLSDLKPFPVNQYFRSQSVLSEESREEIYQQVVVNKMEISDVSVALGVDIRRVAAVVRLKTIEKQWLEEGKRLAKPYNDAVLAMLPQTPLRNAEGNVVRHEPINDLPVHPSTRQQLFHPASESRSFTRVDAAKAFSPDLLPADERIPHPELIELEKWNIQGMSREERLERLVQQDVEKRAAKAAKDAERQAWVERTQRVVPGKRWDFKFQDISVEAAGRDGRGKDAVGLRYGYAHVDRKKGTVRIPTSVE